jgi:hypothetical protein
LVCDAMVRTRRPGAGDVRDTDCEAGSGVVIVSLRDPWAGKTGSGLRCGFGSGRLQHEPPRGRGKVMRSVAG